MLQRKIQTLFDSSMNNKSCENIANDILDYLNLTYPGRNCIIKVQEDNENSAIIEQILWR